MQAMWDERPRDKAKSAREGPLRRGLGTLELQADNKPGKGDQIGQAWEGGTPADRPGGSSCTNRDEAVARWARRARPDTDGA